MTHSELASPEPGRHYSEEFRHFTFDHELNGVIDARGEDDDDQWQLVVTGTLSPACWQPVDRPSAAVSAVLSCIARLCRHRGPMIIADFIVAPFLAAGALWLIRRGVKIWRSPGGDAPLQLMVMGWDRAVLMMGIFLAWLAVAALGQALLDVTKSPVARWVFGVASVAMFVSACLFASIWFFNRPRLLVPPALRGLPGTLRAPGRIRRGQQTRK